VGISFFSRDLIAKQIALSLQPPGRNGRRTGACRSSWPSLSSGLQWLRARLRHEKEWEGRGDCSGGLTSGGGWRRRRESAGGGGSAMEAGSNGTDREGRQRGLDGNDNETVDWMAKRKGIDETNVMVCSPSAKDERRRWKSPPELERSRRTWRRWRRRRRIRVIEHITA
jgi:hypothetical protein